MVDLDTVESLPTVSDAYACLDVILLDGSAKLNDAQSHAIEDWVRSGGHLVVTLGKSGEAYAKTPLAAWNPIKRKGWRGSTI